MNETILKMRENWGFNSNFITYEFRNILRKFEERQIISNIFELYKNDKEISSDSTIVCINKIIEILNAWSMDKSDKLSKTYLSLIEKMKEIKTHLRY